MTQSLRLPATAAITAVLIAHALVGAQVATPAGASTAKARIQLREYTDHATGVVYPLTPVVRIHRGANWATGTLLRNCRIITTLRPLIQMKTAMQRDQLNKGETLVGERFAFDTIPLPALENKPATGQFVVIGHGQLDRLHLEELLDEHYPADWAVGFDEGCLSDKFNLGYARLTQGGSFLQLLDHAKDWDLYFTAGYSTIPALPDTGSPRFAQYIDSRCGIRREGNEEPLLLMRYSSVNAPLEMTCSVAQGGAGQPLLQHLSLANRAKLVEPDGRHRLIVLGLFGRPLPKAAAGIPHVKQPWAIEPFNNALFDKVKPYLEGPVDPALKTRR